ncbi:uncharacterized protein EDB93DRAFT_102546 [Suillus bovinus]|uniref:uncharacterized protein n=1 Tax=Suillus bovinus TaxID=48563 RepID=UPI001B87BBD8|nr:uncharacterized protein EDB93DRAFT_102546 [Suillus bovinus]KAG2155355.1 hypothetical protein EDB93DRAFT_102546 [Suillus bovinus]
MVVCWRCRSACTICRSFRVAFVVISINDDLVGLFRDIIFNAFVLAFFDAFMNTFVVADRERFLDDCAVVYRIIVLDSFVVDLRDVFFAALVVFHEIFLQADVVVFCDIFFHVFVPSNELFLDASIVVLCEFVVAYRGTFLDAFVIFFHGFLLHTFFVVHENVIHEAFEAFVIVLCVVFLHTVLVILLDRFLAIFLDTIVVIILDRFLVIFLIVLHQAFLGTVLFLADFLFVSSVIFHNNFFVCLRFLAARWRPFFCLVFNTLYGPANPANLRGIHGGPFTIGKNGAMLSAGDWRCRVGICGVVRWVSLLLEVLLEECFAISEVVGLLERRREILAIKGVPPSLGKTSPLRTPFRSLIDEKR